MTYNFTYQTKNLINGKTYIGAHSTDNLNDGYLGSGIALQQAIKKYGYENFISIPLAFFDTAKEAFEEEKWLVDKNWISNNYNYNLAIGGKGNIYRGFNKDQKEVHRKNVSIALRARYSIKPKGNLSKSHCNNISKAHTGVIHSRKRRDINSKAQLGKIIPTKTKDKIRKAHLGRKRSEVHRKSMCKWIFITPLGYFYGSIAAGLAHNIDGTTMISRCSNLKERWKSYDMIINPDYKK